MTTRVLIVDDHPVFRAGMVTVLQDLDGVEVVGEASDGEEALRVVAQSTPDVVLMDLRMPGVGGLEATARIRVERPETAVIVLTMDSDDDSLFAALRAGARGYLLKEAADSTSNARSRVSPGGRPSSERGSRSGCWPSSPAPGTGARRVPSRSSRRASTRSSR